MNPQGVPGHAYPIASCTGMPASLAAAQATSWPENRGASVEAIQAHYDVSNDFYALWLDRSMTYSCALWEAGDDLASAQNRKLDFHLEKADARGAARLLDIGCGWGGLLRRAIDQGVTSATGLTLSAAQAEWINRNPDPRLTVAVQAWQDHVPDAPYDSIVSIGAFEHFARCGASPSAKLEGYREFFAWCHRHTRPGAQLSLQSIVYEDYDETRPNKFVEEVFPESELPRLGEIVAAAAGMFEVVQVLNHREHYAKTLDCWLRNLRKHRAAALDIVDDATYRRYEKYLGVFVVGFRLGSVNLSRIHFRKLQKPDEA